MVGLLLAAGESSRMGSPKPLLDWHGHSLLEYQIGELLGADADEVLVVLGYRADELRPLVELAGARSVVNSDYQLGRAGSIRTGAEALADFDGSIVILNVDQPRSRAVTRALLQAHQDGGNLITVPSFQGQRGHPAVLDSGLLQELRQVNEATEGLRALMSRHRAGRVEHPMDDPSVLLDMNLPSDYAAARKTN